jgi:hypothetical protein
MAGAAGRSDLPVGQRYFHVAHARYQRLHHELASRNDSNNFALGESAVGELRNAQLGRRERIYYSQTACWLGKRCFGRNGLRFAFTICASSRRHRKNIRSDSVGYDTESSARTCSGFNRTGTESRGYSARGCPKLSIFRSLLLGGLFLLRYPMLQRHLRYRIHGALKAFPCVGMKFNLFCFFVFFMAAPKPPEFYIKTAFTLSRFRPMKNYGRQDWSLISGTSIQTISPNTETCSRERTKHPAEFSERRLASNSE